MCFPCYPRDLLDGAHRPRSENFFLNVEFSDKDGSAKDNLPKAPTYTEYHKKIKPEFAGKGKKANPKASESGQKRRRTSS